jgi:hypothetical protein
MSYADILTELDSFDNVLYVGVLPQNIIPHFNVLMQVYLLNWIVFY